MKPPKLLRRRKRGPGKVASGLVKRVGRTVTGAARVVTGRSR